MKKLVTPIGEETANNLRVRDMVLISGYIYCGRDAVLPRICDLIHSGEICKTDIHLQGSVIFHTAVSPAGIGPTSSNKVEIEASFETLSSAGVKLHLGKGQIRTDTIRFLNMMCLCCSTVILYQYKNTPDAPELVAFGVFFSIIQL